MEWCRIEVSMETLLSLKDNDVPYKLILVDEKDFDYTSSELWKAAKIKSDKAYKELKRIEYNIRHNIHE